MPSLNSVTIIGHLGQDPEIKYTGSGSAVCNLSVATTEKWKDKSGNRQEHTEWHRVVVWGKQAENCQEYLNKGSLVHVQGALNTEKWQDKDGNDRYTTKIKAFSVLFLDGRKQSAPSEDIDDNIPW